MISLLGVLSLVWRSELGTWHVHALGYSSRPERGSLLCIAVVQPPTLRFTHYALHVLLHHRSHRVPELGGSSCFGALLSAKPRSGVPAGLTEDQKKRIGNFSGHPKSNWSPFRSIH